MSWLALPRDKRSEDRCYSLLVSHSCSALFSCRAFTGETSPCMLVRFISCCSLLLFLIFLTSVLIELE